MRLLRLILLTLLATAGMAVAAAPAHAGRPCDLDVFFGYQGDEYILGDMYMTGTPVTCGRLEAVGKAYTRRRLKRFPTWRCGGTTSPGASVRLTCVKDCSRIEMLVLGLTIDGRPRGTPRRPKRCTR